MRTIAALILAGLLAIMAYGIFWLVCLDYTTAQVRDAVATGLQADISYGTPRWVPDPLQVTMELPAVTLTMRNGPVRALEAGSLRVSSGFLMRDRWSLALPPRSFMTMANGRKLILETEKGEVLWREADNSLTLRARNVRILDDRGQQLTTFDDVMLARKPSDNGVRVNLASRPKFDGVDGVLSGEVVVPPAVFGSVMNLFGGQLPEVGTIMRTVAAGLQKGGQGHNSLEMENISFKAGRGVNGAVNGKIEVMADGRMTGRMSVTADAVDQVMGWIKVAGLTSGARNQSETAGVVRFTRGLVGKRPTVTLENMQTTMTLNGNPVGPLPVAGAVVKRLWP